MSPELQANIGLRLKALYDSVVNEPIPDKLLDLLNKLDAAEASAQPAGAPKRRDGEGSRT